MSNKLAINVVNSERLKPTLIEITSLVAEVIKNTFGPYGHNTLVQTLDSVYSTKDGWNVMRNLRIDTEDGQFSAPVNAIKKLLQDVAQSVVLNAGDGTTTVILAADVLNKLVSKHAIETGMDSRTLEICLKKCVDLINERLDKAAVKITDKNMATIIRQIALISTNWDEEIADMIQEIYITTKNPIIKVEDSGNQNTYVEYSNGYELSGELMLPNHYITDQNTVSFEADNPVMTIFSAPLGKKHTRPLITLSQFIKVPMVIMAPNFDVDFLNIINNMNAEFAETGRKVNIIPCKFNAFTQIDKDCVGDFAALVGTSVLTTQYDKMYNILNELADLEIEKEHGDDPKAKKESENMMRLIASAAKEFAGISGTCEHISVNDKRILVTGLLKDSDEFAKRKTNLKHLLKQKYAQYNAESSMTEMVRSLRIRLGKMECNMGTIKVGGFGKAHIRSRKDSIDDATRACEVAFTSGYVLDGGLAIAKAAEEAMLIQKTKEEEYINTFLKMFTDAFVNVAVTMYNNRYNDEQKCRDIVVRCVNEKSTYNLVTERYGDNELITPVDVCKEIVSGCLRLVLVNCTSNQFVYQTADSLIRAIRDGSDVLDSIEAQKAPEEEVDD